GSTGTGTGTGSNDIVVVPSDVAPLYGSVLDPALFNVSALARDGYDDAHADSLPLIVAHAPGARNAAGTLAAASLQPVRELTSIGATAMREPRRTAARLGAPLSAAGRAAASERSAPGRLAPTAGPLAGVSHIWLDGKVHTTDLDWDLGKIGAPAAWAGGSTGNGVTVAVIDTGVDATHPDLVGNVVGEANFSDSADAADRVGHGTHVAGTIAGSGAASDGARKGVAYDAHVLNVKVLGDDGVGRESWVIAGMEWAAEHGAKVANMSLGGGQTDGQDPESKALNALTAQYGTLFVVAAGNSPPTRYVSSPGTADAALTVGATDSSDHMAGFSAWGPRAGDAAMKPDISAPGVGIVQARAAGTSIGTPVGQYYTTLNGTSMATPHVAGAAALLAAQRPGLSAAQLKAVLQETAVMLADTNVYIQGAGRLDVAAALAQPLIADKATFDFGRFGCTAATTSRQVTITNTGGTDATLDLGLQLTDPSGQAAAAGTATLSTTRSSIAAGKSATISVTVDPSKATAGLYSGAVVATPQGGGAPLHLPIGFMDDPNYCGIHLSAVGRDGQPAVGIAVSMDLTTGFRGRNVILIPTGGTTFFGVRGDRYSLIASVQQPLPGDRLAAALITVPELAATAETNVTLDMRTSKPASVDIPKRPTVSSLVTLNAARTTANGNSLRFSNVAGGPYGNLADYDLYGGQTADGPVKTGTLQSTLYVRQVDAGHVNDPAGADTVYDLAWTGQLFPGDMRHVLNPQDVARLARVDAHYHSLGTPGDGSVDCEERLPSLNGSPLFYPCLPVRLPVQRTEYVTPGITWQRQFWHVPADSQILQWQSVGSQTYRPAAR
ncbi:MAG: peptidase, partial [Pseudonocardiales bacterium]|nr:peptidase [Pseudonocardiales bacterium]